MNAQATRRGVPAVALWGGVGVLAWAALTVVFGGGSAQADEHQDPSLLGGASSLVSQTVSTVETTVVAATQPVVAPVVADVVAPVVTDVVAPVVSDVVAPAVTQVAAPVQQVVPPVVDVVVETVEQTPVVAPVTAPIVDAVVDTAESVVTPVTDLLQDGPASQIVDPILDVVDGLPIVGTVLDELGVTGVVDDVVDVVDDATGIVGETVDGTLPPLLGAVDPVDTDGPASSVPVLAPADSAADAGSVAAAASERGSSRIPAPTSAFAPGPVATPATDPSATAPASGGDDRLPTPAGAPSGSSSAASGASSTLSHARVSDVGISPLSVRERSAGSSDDVLPTSLMPDTDVSPD